MNGPQHYRMAEQLDSNVQQFVDLAKSTADAGNSEGSEAAKWAAGYLIARAQMHATLALVAATADATIVHRVVETDETDDTWLKAIYP